MKLIIRLTQLILVIGVLGFLISCSTDETILSTQNFEDSATGDQGDDTGDPDSDADKNIPIIVKDSIIDNITATGDQGDDPGNPDD